MRIEDLKLKIENYGISFLLFISSLFKRKATSADLKKMEFSTSTQKMGVSFTDKMRDIFRHKWIKKA
ncbi:MAG: hypothetical protein ABSE89_07005 [Sedimentisphaerales bacterium]